MIGRHEDDDRRQRVHDLRLLAYVRLDYLHSAKGGAVETGCRGLHYIIGCFTI